MSGEANTKTVVRMLMAWNDEKEERWLAEQARAGWRLKAVRCFGYTFERAAPADLTYRLDFGPSRRSDRSEYFGLFHDAGWKHVGTRGLWQYFRKAVVDGQVPEIHTDPQSRIAMYRRVIAIMAVMLGVIVMQTAPRLATEGQAALSRDRSAILVIQMAVMAFFAYGIVRLLLVISRLRRSAGRDTSLKQP
jgi:Protein of unknown function (DUF2812)